MDSGQWTKNLTADSGQKIGHWTVDKNWTLDSGQKIVDKKLNNGQHSVFKTVYVPYFRLFRKHKNFKCL